MSEESDPTAVRDALSEATEAFDEEGHGMPTREAGIDTDADWKIQLTKACKLLGAVKKIDSDGYDTAVIELCFGVIERSLEAFALAEGGDELADFHDHTHCYDRAAALGFLSRGTATELVDLYRNNRTESYYGGRRPTRRQARAMQRLAREIHRYAGDQIREGGVCTCDL